MIAHQPHGKIERAPDQRLAALGEHAGERARETFLAGGRLEPAGQQKPHEVALTNRDGL